MSATLKKIGVEVTNFSKERQDEALHQLSQLRLDSIIMHEGETFDWGNVIAKPELLEIKDQKPKDFKTFKEDDIYNDIDYEWPYAETSLYFFKSDHPIRLSLYQTLRSQKFIIFMRIITLINIIAVCAYDYSVRVWDEYSERNRICITIEIFCNIIFGAEVCMEVIVQGFVMEKKSYLRSGWNIINFSTFIATWAVLGDINSNNQLIHILRIVRLFRVLRFIQDSILLKTQMDAFIGSFPKLGPILIPLLFVVLFYSIVGLHLFMGITEYRCRSTPEPTNGEWELEPDIYFLCGIWDCPENSYCGSKADYNLPRNMSENNYLDFSFNFNRFDDFFYSLLVVFTFLNVTGWSGTTFMFWRAMTTYATAFYFVSLILLLAYILSNLLLATFYESFVDNSSIKSSKNIANKEKEALEEEIKKKKQKQIMSRLAALNEAKATKKQTKKRFQLSLYFSEEENQKALLSESIEKFQQFSRKIATSNYFLYMNSIMILLCSIIIVSDHNGISKQNYEGLLITDFVCILYFIFELCIQIWGRGLQEYLNEIINVFDFVIVLSQIILIIVLFFLGQPIIINYEPYVNFVKAFKIIRLMKFLYIAKIFYTISVLARCLIQTIIKIRDMILLFIILILVVSLFGQELIAYKVFFDKDSSGRLVVAQDKKTGISDNINYEGFGNSFMAATNIFYNEEWHVSMFYYAQELYVSLIYHMIVILMGQVLFVRLLTAVFLNEFCRQLKKIEEDLKPIDVIGSIKQFFASLSLYLRPRSRTKVHHQSQIKPINQAVEKHLNRIRPSIFHDLKQVGPTQKNNSDKMEINDLKIPTPSNIFSNKESMMINPLQKGGFEEWQSKSKDYQPDQKEKKLEDNDYEEEPEVDDDEKKSPISEQPQAVVKKLTSVRKQRGNDNRTLFIFAPESDFRMLVTTLVTNVYFRVFNFTLILLTCVRIALLNPTEDPNSDLSYVLKIGYIFLTVFYGLVILLNCIAFGLYKTQTSYFRQSIYNIFAFVITIVDLITLIFDIQHALSKFITSLRILQFIQIGAAFSKNIGYAQTSLLNAFAKMIQLAFFCFFILAMYGVLALKLLKGTFYYCSAIDSTIAKDFVFDRLDCMDYGGSWVNQILNFDSIFQSILTLFVVATTECWVPLVFSSWSAVGSGLQPLNNFNRWWAAYFQIFFFLGNLCMLNMFIGLIVNAFQEAKMKAQNLDLLDDNQREWFLIKMSIFNMRPLVKSKMPENPIRKKLFFVVKNKRFKQLWLIIILLNTIILSMYFHRQSQEYKNVLDYFNLVFVYIFAFEILCRFFAKDKKMYFKDTPNLIDIIGIWLALSNLYVRNEEDINFHFRRIFNAMSVTYQLTRNFRIIKRFNDLEKLFSSIFSIIPSALSMMFIMIIFMFIYTTLGIDMFAYLRAQSYINGWDLHFRKFTTAMFSLVRVASSEFWFALLIDSLHDQNPDFACINMNNYEDYKENGYNGCGTPYAYLFYISFHLIFSLMILNLFIASILGAYEEHVKSEESAISKYQLFDVLCLWRNYDTEGKGFINYKDFWKLSSEIAITFGVDQADLLDVNNKKNFLKVLNIPIYEAKGSNMLCYRFHDVILSLTKISVTLKFSVTNLEPTDKNIQQKLAEQIGDVEKNYNQDQFLPTSFNSGDMVAIITIQKKFRFWKRRVQIRREGGDPEAMFNEMSDIKNMIKRQIEIEERQEEEERKKLKKD